MPQVGKLGIELVELIEKLIANGPTKDGILEVNVYTAFDKFMTELDYEYCERLNNKEPDLFDPL